MAEIRGRVVKAESIGYKVVFVGEGDSEGWSIIEDEPYSGTAFIASHIACNPEEGDEYDVEANEPKQGIMSWFHNEEDALCYYCGVPVPDEIQALIHLSSSF